MKTKSSLIIGVCIATLVLCAPVTTPAKTNAAPAPSATPAASASPMAKTATGKANRSVPFRGKIASVDAKAKTFTVAGKETSRVVKITDQTAITKQGVAATMKDVVANEEVRGLYWKKEDGSLEAKSIRLGPPTAEEMAKRDARKQKKAGSATEASPSSSP